MWQNSDLALALHRERVGEAARRPRLRRESPVHLAVPGPALRPAAAPRTR
jgi:hypothetical protein